MSAPRTLTVQVDPSGKGKIVTLSPDSGIFDLFGTTTTKTYQVRPTHGVDVKARPYDPAYAFAGWSGAASGTDADTSFVMPFADAAVTAHFHPVYAPGCPLEVHLVLDDPASQDLRALGLYLDLPPGWTYQGAAANGAGGLPQEEPAVGSTGPLQFAWVQIPAFPIDLTLTLNVPATATGPLEIAARTEHRTTGAAIHSAPSLLRLLPAAPCPPNPYSLNHTLPTETAPPPEEGEGAGQGPNGPEAMMGAQGGGSNGGDTVGDPFTLCTRHHADQNDDWGISLSELLRVIQFFNSTGYGCEPGTEDGYAPNDPDQDCAPHHSDYNAQNWVISLSELLRLIQFFNYVGYKRDDSGEDGFAPSEAANTDCDGTSCDPEIIVTNLPDEAERIYYAGTIPDWGIQVTDNCHRYPDPAVWCEVVPKEFVPGQQYTVKIKAKLDSITPIELEHEVSNVTVYRPNFLFINSDDLNDWVSYLDVFPKTNDPATSNELTPSLHALAEESIVFTRAYCAAPLCAPSRAAIILGRHPANTGIYGQFEWFRATVNGSALDSNNLALPKYLYTAGGYNTLGAGKFAHDHRMQDIAWLEWLFGNNMNDFSPESQQDKYYRRPPEPDVFDAQLVEAQYDSGLFPNWGALHVVAHPTTTEFKVDADGKRYCEFTLRNVSSTYSYDYKISYQYFDDRGTPSPDDDAIEIADVTNDAVGSGSPSVTGCECEIPPAPPAVDPCGCTGIGTPVTAASPSLPSPSAPAASGNGTCVDDVEGEKEGDCNETVLCDAAPSDHGAVRASPKSGRLLPGEERVVRFEYGNLGPRSTVVLVRHVATWLGTQPIPLPGSMVPAEVTKFRDIPIRAARGNLSWVGDATYVGSDRMQRCLRVHNGTNAQLTYLLESDVGSNPPDVQFGTGGATKLEVVVYGNKCLRIPVSWKKERLIDFDNTRQDDGEGEAVFPSQNDGSESGDMQFKVMLTEKNPPSPCMGEFKVVLVNDLNEEPPLITTPPAPVPDAKLEMSDTLVTKRVTDWLGLLASGGAGGLPFFLSAGVYRPHVPMYLPLEYFDVAWASPLPPHWMAEVTSTDPSQVDPCWGDYLTLADVGYTPLEASNALLPMTRAYMASMNFADKQVGDMLAALDSDPGLKASMIVVFWSDHGWNLGEKHRVHKQMLWERTTRAPLLVRIPGVGKRTVDAPVSLADLYPTLLELVGLPVPGAVETAAPASARSVSLAPLLTGERKVRSTAAAPETAVPVVSAFLRPRYASVSNMPSTCDAVPDPVTPARDLPFFSVRNGEYRYIRYKTGNDATGNELYAHEATGPNSGEPETINLLRQAIPPLDVLTEMNAVINFAPAPVQSPWEISLSQQYETKNYRPNTPRLDCTEVDGTQIDAYVYAKRQNSADPGTVRGTLVFPAGTGPGDPAVAVEQGDDALPFGLTYYETPAAALTGAPALRALNFIVKFGCVDSKKQHMLTLKLTYTQAQPRRISVLASQKVHCTVQNTAAGPKAIGIPAFSQPMEPFDDAMEERD